MFTISRHKHSVKASSLICALSGQLKLTNPLDRSGVLPSQKRKNILYVRYRCTTVCICWLLFTYTKFQLCGEKREILIGSKFLLKLCKMCFQVTCMDITVSCVSENQVWIN